MLYDMLIKLMLLKVSEPLLNRIYCVNLDKTVLIVYNIYTVYNRIKHIPDWI